LLLKGFFGSGGSGLKWTGTDKWFISGLFFLCFGNFVGKTWEKLGTFSISNQGVTN
jgi:hypothetical protein